MNEVELAHLEGFLTKCAEYGIDPEALLVKQAQDAEEKKDGPIKATARGAGKGALAGGAIGAGLGAVTSGAGMANMLSKHPVLTAGVSKSDKLKAILKSALQGGAAGGVTGGAMGALTGGVIGANK